MSDHRYQALIKAAGGFFEAAEQEQATRRQAVIEEIRHTMSLYGLTVADLSPPEAPTQAGN